MDKVIECFADKLVSYFSIHGYIDKTKESVYKYGTIVAIQSVINIVSTVILGMIFGFFFENLCFLFIFRLIRKFSGGFHFEKFIVCFFISVVVNIFFLLSLKFFLIYPGFSLILLIELTAIIIVIFLSPITNINKTISKTEYIIYKLVVFIVCLILFFCSILLTIFNIHFVYSICIAIVFDSISVIIGKINILISTKRVV